MHKSLSRRQRHRRLDGGRRRSSGGGTVKAVAIALPLFLFSTLVLVGLAGFVGVVAAYNGYSEGLKDPKEIFSSLDFDQQTRIYDRTGSVELARLGDFKRELVAFEDLPPELVDATTAIEDKSFWENAGFDPLGIVSAGIDTLRGNERGASTITQQLVRARLLPSEAFEGSVYERKIREIIQSVRLTQAYKGEEGKQQIMAAYLNNNFYGNQSYGVKAAARTYFDKDLSELTLSEVALLAGIPQAPTRFDLVRNAEMVCTVEVAEGEACPVGSSQLVVSDETEIVQRRDYILELMKTRSPLSGGDHALAEYDRAKEEPVILAPQAQTVWKAPHFVWQVQRQLAEIVCGTPSADDCPAVGTGGYQVTTTLDWVKQQSVEKWLFISARAPNSTSFEALLDRYKIAAADRGWLRELAGRNIHNAASAVEDARTGEILAYAGSAGYYWAGTEKFQPQFDVLSDGYRQPGSAIKPIDYAIGLDDRTMTAATMFMDVVTNFGTEAKPYTPKQADDAERGPVRLRSALQFSLNVPAIKAGLYNGLDHQFERSKDFGLRFLDGAVPVVSMSIGTLETRPIDMLSAYSALANAGVRMPQRMILEVRDPDGNVVWPLAGDQVEGERVVSPEAAWIMSDILRGNTNEDVNPYWADWAIYDDGDRREAAYKTGTTEDNRDVAAYGYLAPPADPEAPQLVVGVWMGNSDNDPNNGSLSLDSSAPLWSRILTEVSAGTPFAGFDAVRPGSLVQAKVDAFSGLLPGAFTSKSVTEWFIPGTAPEQADNTKVVLEIDSASGLRWQEGCAGPMETRGFFDVSKLETAFPDWQPYTQNWASRAARGTGVSGGPEGTRTTIFYNSSFAPFGRSWGAPFAPSATCEPLPPPDPCDPFASPLPSPSDPLAPEPSPCPSLEPSPDPSSEPTASPRPRPSPKPSPTPKPSKPPKPSPSPSP
jgi:membrane peptidoglycan carboxypeptidase